MRLSISITNFSWPESRADIARGHAQRPLAEALVATARAADDGGLHGVWLADHLLQKDPYGARPGETEMLEAYTTLGYLAHATSRVQLGTLVSAVTFRPPALLIKAVTTLDVLSGGRAMFGIGAGYQGEEAAEMDLPLPPLRERFERLEETLQIARAMWSDEPKPFVGKHYRLENPVGSPRPVQQPHPPVLIGGTGERRTLPLVARYADACNVFDIPDGGATVRHKLDVLRACCDETGRPYDAIEKVISSRLEPGEEATAFVERCATFASWGIEHVALVTTGPWTVASLDTLSAAVPDVAALAPT